MFACGAGGDALGPEDVGRREERRTRFWRQKEKRDRERREQRMGGAPWRWEDVELDLKGVGKVEEPKRARVREWKMWNMP